MACGRLEELQLVVAVGLDRAIVGISAGIYRSLPALAGTTEYDNSNEKKNEVFRLHVE